MGFAIRVLIVPLLKLYIKYKMAQIAIRFILFVTIYTLFKEGMQYIINTVFARIMGLNFPCPIAFILNGLDIFSMINFALSIWATIYIGRFFLDGLKRLI